MTTTLPFSKMCGTILTARTKTETTAPARDPRAPCNRHRRTLEQFMTPPPLGSERKGRRDSRQRDPPSPASRAQEEETGGGGGGAGGVKDGQGAWHHLSIRPLRPTGSQEGGLHALSRPPPSPTRETPSRPTPQQTRAPPPAEAPPTSGGPEREVRHRQHTAQGQTRPILRYRTRAPTPPLSSGARARPRRAHRDYALLPLPHEANPLRPPHPLTQPHTSRPPALREAEKVSHPLKNTHPRIPRYPPPGSPARRALTAKLLRPLLTACPSQHEAPRTAQGIGPPKRTGSSLSANEAVTGPDAQTRKEGGRETLRGKGRGGEMEKPSPPPLPPRPLLCYPGNPAHSAGPPRIGKTQLRSATGRIICLSKI